jgi:ATP-dependent Lon protease
MKKINQFEGLSPENLRINIDPDSLGFENTKECEYSKGVIGQEGAVKAVQMGLEIKSPGYNIYAAGLIGTGKTSTIKRLLDQLDTGTKIPNDICYVNNFKNPDMPSVIMLPAGEGTQFQKDMDEMILHLEKKIPRIFDSEDFKKTSEQIVSSHIAKQKEMVKEFNEKIQKEHFQLVQYQVGPYARQDIVPVYEDKPTSIDQLEALAEQDKFSQENLEKIKTKLSELRIEFDGLMRETRQIEKEIRSEMNSRTSNRSSRNQRADLRYKVKIRKKQRKDKSLFR